MIKIIIVLVILGPLASCVPTDDSFFATSFDKAASVKVPTDIAFVKDVSTGVDLEIGLLGKSKEGDIKLVTLFIEFVPSGEISGPEENAEQFIEITSYPNTITISEAQLLEVAGKNSVSDLTLGDRWIIKYQVTLLSGRVLTHGVRTNIEFT